MKALRRSRAVFKAMRRQKIPITFLVVAIIAVMLPRFWEWLRYKIGILTALMGMISLNQWAVIVGIVCTIIHCLSGIYFDHKKYKLAERSADKENDDDEEETQSDK